MAEFTFTSPEGKSYTVSGPEGATKEQAFQVLQQQLKPTGGATEAAAGGFVGGIPVIGPALKSGAQYAAGGIRSLITGNPFSEELGKVQGYAKRTEEAHPTAETAGEIGGGVYGMGVAGAAAPTAMGLTGTLPQMIGRGAVSGGVIGAADAAARGQDSLGGGGIGMVGGAAGPVVGRVAGAVAAPVVSAYRGIRDPAGEASRRLASTISRDIRARQGQAVRPEQGLTAGEFQQAKTAGQPVMAQDVGGESTRALARSAANTSPEARQVLDQAINQRYEGQSQRLTDWLRTNFHYPDAQAQQQALDQVSRTVNRANYEEAYTRGSHDLYLASSKLQQLAGSDVVAAAMGAANKSQKEEMILHSLNMAQTVGKAVPVVTTKDLRFWDQVHKELQDAAIRAGHGTNESRRIGRFDQELKAELDRLVPSYQTARQGAAKFFGAENALEAGQKAVTSKMKNDQIRAGLEKLSPQERQLFQDGYVDRLVQTIRESGDRRNVADKIINSDAARERLEMAVGPDKARELQTFVRVENIMDFARKAVQGNSTTARQLAELGLAGGVGAGTELYEAYEGRWRDPQALMNASLMYGAARGRNVIDQRVAQQVATLLTSGDIKRALTVISNNPKMFKAIQNADAAIGAVITRGSVPPSVRGMMKPKPQLQPEPEYGGPQQ